MFDRHPEGAVRGSRSAVILRSRAKRGVSKEDGGHLTMKDRVSKDEVVP
jgi:cation transport regulator ChaC